MSGHVVKYTKSFSVDKERPYWAQCACGQNSGWRAKRSECQDWEYAHSVQAERALAALTTKTPTLKSQRDYYRSKADDVNLSRRERDQWDTLASELDRRLNDLNPLAGQDPLF